MSDPDAFPCFVWHGADAEGHPLWLEFECQSQKRAVERCEIALRPSQVNALGASWEFDGNYQAPTVTPSIKCNSLEGCHFFIEAGKFRHV